jgi:hypothetical protein
VPRVQPSSEPDDHCATVKHCGSTRSDKAGRQLQVDRSARMETKDVAPLTAGPVPAPASQPPPLTSIAPPPPQQHQH